MNIPLSCLLGGLIAALAQSRPQARVGRRPARPKASLIYRVLGPTAQPLHSSAPANSQARSSSPNREPLRSKNRPTFYSASLRRFSQSGIVSLLPPRLIGQPADVSLT